MQHADAIDVVCAARGVTIGVVATPAEAAQRVCDHLVSAGVRSILNFAPTVLAVPAGVEVRKVDLAVEMQVLSFHVARRHGTVPAAGPAARVATDPARGVLPMSLLLVGVSHRTAEVPVLERVAVSPEDTRKVLDELLTGEHVTEAMLVSTCNRVEIYAVVETFHGGLTEVSNVLARHAHAEVSDLTDHLYVHYAGSAVEHLFSVAAGLDSMVVGEAQILGQLRAVLRRRPRARLGRAACCTSWPSRRCGSASAPTPRPGSTPRAPRWSPRPSPTPRPPWAGWPGAARSWSAPGRWAP